MKDILVLYTTDCPKCKIIERFLSKLGLYYKIERRIELMQIKGYTSAPVLEVNGKPLFFSEALEYLRGINESPCI